MDYYNNNAPKVELNTEQEAFLRNCTSERLMDRRFIARKLAELGSDSEVRQLESSLAMAQHKEQTVKLIRRLLVKAGTDVDKNDKDPYGDGDQTLLAGVKLESQRQILRNLFAAGGDIEHHLRNDGLTSFSWSCIKGDTKAIERRLKEASLKGKQAVTQLIEYRQTSMRLTPLLLTVALSKHKNTVKAYSQRKVADMDHVGVFRTLIRYGARPDAKDVTGKTVCHYGAGVMATNETLEMTKMAVKAIQTCAFFGHKVVLNGLTKTEYNGMKGRLGGYVAEKERLVMYPNAGSAVEHELALKAENIFIEKEDDDGAKQQICILQSSTDTRTNLIDMRDRVGSISMHEVVMSQRDDVAKFLCKHSTTCLDVADGSGTTIRQMMCVTFPIKNKVMPVLKKHAAKQVAKERCGSCGKQGKLMECIRCLSVAYCSKKCQVSDWKGNHKKDCKRLQSEGELLLGRPKSPISSGYTVGHYRYGPPDGLNEADKSFWIKVQSNGIKAELLIYDESRTCNFMLPPGESGHRELVEKISQEPTFLGRKSFFKAKFDEKGRCMVYIRTSTAKKW